MFSDKLNRSFSESDISQFHNLSLSSPRDFIKPIQNSCSSIVRRVYIEEIISCGEKQLGILNATDADIGSMTVPSFKRRERMYASIEDQDTFEEVPMEIDSSYTEERFPKMMGTGKSPRLRKFEFIDLDEYDNSIDQAEPIQKSVRPVKLLKREDRQARLIHINSVKNKEKKNHCFLILSIAVPVLILLVYYSGIIDVTINTEVDLQSIQKDLLTNIYGHKHLVDNFINILEKRSMWSEKIKVISFVGSQGVGKTYFANIVQQHLSRKLVHNIYGTHLYYAIEKENIVESIHSCCLNLVVIDDLKLSDSIELFAFVHSLPKDCLILVIAIFNIHYTDDNLNSIVNYDDVMKVRDNFDNSGIKDHELFVFEDFTYDQIKDWTKKELTLKNVSSKSTDKILHNILDTHNINQGLKGLNSKILLELEKYRE